MKLSFSGWILASTLALLVLSVVYNYCTCFIESVERPKLHSSQKVQLNTKVAQKKLPEPIKGITLGMHSKDPEFDYSFMICKTIKSNTKPMQGVRSKGDDQSYHTL